MKTFQSRCTSQRELNHTVSVALMVGLFAFSTAVFAVGAVPPGAHLAASHSQVAASSPGVPDIRDIRPPFHIVSGWWWWAGAAAACGALGIAAGGRYLWRRRTSAANKSAAELALEQLKEARVLLLPGQARAFSIAVSGIVRTYIEQRFNIAASQQTTREFLQGCLGQSSGSLAAHRQSLEDFLQYCDLAKFARWMPSTSEMEALLHSAIAFVDATVVLESAGPGGRQDPLAPEQQQRSVLRAEASQT